MTKMLKCDCGYKIESASDDEIVQAAQSHARVSHNMELTREQVLSMVQPVADSR